MSACSPEEQQQQQQQKEYEVEAKFALGSVEETARIEQRLRDLGFQPQPKSRDVRMVDWYWEDATTATTGTHPWTLTTQDCWLRLRDDGSTCKWQLKVGRKVVDYCNDDGNDGSTATATVYEEVTGSKAITKALALLRLPPDTATTAAATTTTTTTAKLEEGGPIQIQPHSSSSSSSLLDLFLRETQGRVELPDGMTMMATSSTTTTTTTDPLLLLVPFARIETRRSSWIPSLTCQQQQQPPVYANLKVDFDVATYANNNNNNNDDDDDVYAVGEVEEVVDNETEIPNARRRVRDFLHQLLILHDGDDDVKPTTTNKMGRTTTEPPPVIMGKLEYYLIKHRPKHYQALLDSGILSK